MSNKKKTIKIIVHRFGRRRAYKILFYTLAILKRFFFICLNDVCIYLVFHVEIQTEREHQDVYGYTVVTDISIVHSLSV